MRTGQRSPWLQSRPVVILGLGFLGLLGTVACTESRTPDPPGPTIEWFEATASTVELGAMVNLRARFTGGEGVVSPGEKPVRSGDQVAVAPTETTAYALTVTGPGGRAARKLATVTVRPGLTIAIEGHEGVAGQVTVQGPGGYSRVLQTSGLLTGLEAGEYTVTAAPAVVGQTTLHPWQPVQRFQVTTGTAVTVRYPAPAMTVRLPGGVPLDFVLIPAGTFTMGEDRPADPLRLPSPCPAHGVTLSRAFYMAKVPTTQAQWQALLGSNPSEQRNPDYPVTNVSYFDVKNTFLPAANAQVPGMGFRLPSEAEWEYACRAGTTTTYFHGEDPLRIWDYAWSTDDFLTQEHPVGRKRPNPWGLYDLAGLVFQWCEDLACDGYRGAPTDGVPRSDPVGPGLAGDGIVRGYSRIGSILPGGNPIGGSALRWARQRECHCWDVGFRLLAVPSFSPVVQ